jgi:hypothetical protein
MAISVTHKHAQAIVRWYLLEETMLIMRGYLAYAKALIEIIPLPFLFLTLLKPWKNIRERKRGHGFDFKAASERLVLNIFSRVVGAVVRLIAMALGIVLQAVLLTLSIAYLLLWILFPCLTVVIAILLLRAL